MGNCYAACHADFERTVQMVAQARDLREAHVKEMLARLRREFGETAEFQRLRARLPESFAF